MDSIADLEERVTREGKKARPDDLDALARHYWTVATDTDDFRERRTHLKRSSYFVGLAFAAGADAVEQLELYRTIVQRASEVHDSPEHERRLLSKIIAKWLEKTGADKYDLVKTAKGAIVVESGLMSLGDRMRFDPFPERGAYGQDEVRWTNEGKHLSFGTGEDGLYKAELRLIDAAEPVLTAAEYKKLSSSTSTVVIDVASGALGMADFVQFCGEPWGNKEIEGTLCLDVPTGRYKACAFGFASARGESVIGVVTPTSDPARNETKTVDGLFG